MNKPLHVRTRLAKYKFKNSELTLFQLEGNFFEQFVDHDCRHFDVEVTSCRQIGQRAEQVVQVNLGGEVGRIDEKCDFTESLANYERNEIHHRLNINTKYCNNRELMI